MIMLTHLNTRGEAHMVDVSDKAVTRRTAVASGVVSMQAETMLLLESNGLPKGDALATIRLAGIMAAKRTSELIPLCHPLNIRQVDVSAVRVSDTELQITAEVVALDTTGVEMEALTAVTVAALTAVDMCKAVDKTLCIRDVRLLKKTGGKSGDFCRGEENARQD